MVISTGHDTDEEDMSHYQKPLPSVRNSGAPPVPAQPKPLIPEPVTVTATFKPKDGQPVLSARLADDLSKYI
jgi:hypothetical protein